MASELTPELRQAIDASTGGPPEFVDPRNSEHYVLIRASIYERLAAILDSAEMTEEEKAADLGEWAKRTGYFDPSMDDYDNLLPPKQ